MWPLAVAKQWKLGAEQWRLEAEQWRLVAEQWRLVVFFFKQSSGD